MICRHLNKTLKIDRCFINGLLVEAKADPDVRAVVDYENSATFIGLMNGMTWPYTICREYRGSKANPDDLMSFSVVKRKEKWD